MCACVLSSRGCMLLGRSIGGDGGSVVRDGGVVVVVVVDDCGKDAGSAFY